LDFYCLYSCCRCGNEDRQGNLSDLTFIVQQQLHPAFRRLADELYAIVNVPLVTALTGGPVALRTLGGQLLQLPVGESDVITPGSELVLPNQGMPVFGDAAGRRGALHVRLNVHFPSVLSRQQQLLLRHTLQVRRHAQVVG
jgi:DnaJ-class molecular chaperone